MYKNKINCWSNTMEGYVIEGCPDRTEDDEKPKETDSAVTFQRFVYDLFEKNGILNDLRAYLRGHIVDVLKNAQTGEPPTCQKHFTQRLELTYQALNMLIAEYLLRLEFSYTLSVFVSEIPLANMVFNFAKTLMSSTNEDFENLKFKDSDVWSILNYLGVKCDSEHASQIVETYNGKENLPLLFCILKCMPMYQPIEEPGECYERQAISSSESLSSVESVGFKHAKSASKVSSAHNKCKHYVFCKACQARMTRLREKYRSKKKNLVKNFKTSYEQPMKVENLMRNIDVMERSLVDEMFQQLKGVYETEVEMMKQDEEKKIKRSLASHTLQLHRLRDEMEESFKAREVELERNVQEKKQFLWGLAKALRDQHATMARAMLAVRGETDRLTAKEDSLKSQLLEAEKVLRKRGEEMRKQISNELAILESHLESMKKERESINKERSELESLKTACNSSCVIKVHDLNTEELRSHYDLLKDELGILKKYIETTKLEPKCVIERSTSTEPCDSKVQAMNNEPDVERSPQVDEDRKTPNKVVNDLKKQKNVNFRASNVDELYHESSRSRSRSRSRSSSEVGDAERDLELVDQLRDENERLKTFARQQRDHIDELTSHQARLHAELGCSRPRTAPAHLPQHPHAALNASASVNSVGWRKGAGEELSLFANAQPRILLPGDTLPFIGVLRDRHSDNRRHLINQWRALRRRMSPLGGVNKVRVPVAPRERTFIDRPGAATPGFPSSDIAEDMIDVDLQPRINETFTFTAVPRERPKTAVSDQGQEVIDRRPRQDSTLRDSKEKEKPRNTYVKKHAPSSTREKSPTSVLREAKLRLRKLEIEAEAVEKSYLDFRRRQAELKRTTPGPTRGDDVIAEIDLHRSKSPQRIEENYKVDVPRFTVTHENAQNLDFDKYLCEYQSKIDAAASHFRDATAKTKPIPAEFSNIAEFDETQERNNYLETPLAEFRKLYTQKPPVPSVPVHFPNIENVNETAHLTPDSGRDSPESRNKTHRGIKSKKDELEILKDNISKMYNLQNQGEIEQKIEDSIGKSESPKLKENLTVEVENVSETNSLKVIESNTRGDLVLVVESSVDTKEINVPKNETKREVLSTHMTIIVSPKRSSPNGCKATESSPVRTERSVSPEQAARLTRNDALNAIFHADATKRQSSIEMELNISNDLIQDSISDFEKGGEEYPDDFSADVDNYNSRSDYDNHSPISLPKTSVDDNFWDT